MNDQLSQQSNAKLGGGLYLKNRKIAVSPKLFRGFCPSFAW